jgi:gluconate 5-dehydrogenase
VTIESMTDSGLPKNTVSEHALVRRAAPEPLAGTRVLVSGATSGLGRAMASALVEAGAEVIITGRQLARAQASAARLGARAVGLELDVRDETSVRAAVEQAWDQLGGVDVLVNNAGIGMRTVNPRFLTDPQPFWEVSPEGFRDVLDTKATGSFILARELVPRMLDAGGGRVVNISMNEQTMIRRGFVPYGPSGAAVEALSRVMAADLAETSVRVNILLPGGATATGMVPEDAPAEVRASLLDPAVMGPPIVWLASSDAEDVHDERIVASGFQSWLASRTP